MRLGQSITRNSLLLALFALVTAALLAGSYLLTRERIAEARRAAEEKALLQIVPAARHDNAMLDDTLPLPRDAQGLGLHEDKVVYVARQGREAVAVIIPVTARDGYSGDIDLIVGVNADGSVAGVRVLSHKETPGLGDRVDLGKSDWVLSFDGRSLGNPPADAWKVKKDKGVFDSFTGATITPRAVVGAVRRVLEYAQAHRAELFGKSPAAAAGDA
ncbi:electron transport complex subunit RsxG [Mangrovimicrobium sediminis]|uniref:Ion-translocating oxidoreductase complex subunit G n=1 Tax=Mangrovimicrobium sediminis TaxID=2562682 RepID=A0A4Z0LV84_9GAMM|nr:electron transport complex subunit RsxG [Haliea sp. SAOS-164]TGD71179.1 electron transport complex subunit RsxG [Haliea sp. SAOS-164]